MKENIKFVILIFSFGFIIQTLVWQSIIMIRFLLGQSTTIYETDLSIVILFDIPMLLFSFSCALIACLNYTKQIFNENLMNDGL